MNKPQANPQLYVAGELTADDIAKLKREFSAEVVGVKVQSLSRDKTRALLVAYVQHTDVADRLDEVDPSWVCTILDERTAAATDKKTASVYVRMRLTVKGVTRENVGEGDDPKSAYSDALKRCAMLFGVGRYLYDQEKRWVPYNERDDKYRSWTLNDIDGVEPRPTKPEQAPRQAAAAPSPAAGPFEFTIGRHAGTTFEAFGAEALAHWVLETEAGFEKRKQKLEGEVAAQVARAKAWLHKVSEPTQAVVSPPQAAVQSPAAAKPHGEDRRTWRITDKQVNRLFAIAYGKGLSRARVLELVHEATGKEDAKEMIRAEYDKLCNRISSGELK